MTAAAPGRFIRLCWALCCVCLLLTDPGRAQLFFSHEEFEKEYDGFPLSFRDLDNDGRVDLLFLLTGLSGQPGQPDPSPDPRVVVLSNQGDGEFRESQVIQQRYADAVDYDNDGDLDLFCYNDVLRNDHGTFVGITGHTKPPGYAYAFFDHNRDGYLDFLSFTWDEIAFAGSSPESVVLNNGDGTFEEIEAERIGLEVDGFVNSVVSSDFNNDDWPDFYIVEGDFQTGTESPNQLFLSDGSGSFRNATTSEIADPGLGSAVAIGDINNDGFTDIFQAAYTTWDNAYFRPFMLLNMGEGSFLDVTDAVGLSELNAEEIFDPGLLDVDNDGDLDLFVGRYGRRHNERGYWLYLNQGDGTFSSGSDIGLERGGIGVVGTGSIVGDYDADGFLDVALQTGLLRNNGNVNHWLTVEPVGIQSNRSGVGTKVVATAGKSRQWREIPGGIGSGSQSEPVAHFGLGDHTQVDTLEIRWPSGQVDVLTDIPVDQKVRVFEGHESFQVVRPTVWREVTDSLVAGSTVDFQATVRPALFEPDAQVIRVVADLSELGGPEAAPLVNAGDGTYKLESVSLVLEPPYGRRSISVMIDQSTSLGSYWTQLPGTITVLPPEDMVLFGDALREDWQLVSGLTAELDLEATAHTYQGAKALGVKTDGNWRVTYTPAEPVDPFGYEALHFAFHPGDARGTTLILSLDGSRMNLLSKEPEDIRVELDDSSWQIIEIPLASMGFGDAITSIFFTGRMEGTFYLDDIRLVAAEPPASITAVTEDYAATRLPSFTLNQNYPNPFNSATVIRFALPVTADVDLAIFNLAGQRVATLAERVRQAGTYTVRWDGHDDDGRALASGVYLYRLRTGDGQQIETRKLLLLR